MKFFLKINRIVLFSAILFSCLFITEKIYAEINLNISCDPACVDPTNINVNMLGKTTLKADVAGGNMTGSYVWTSSDYKIVDVNCYSTVDSVFPTTSCVPKYNQAGTANITLGVYGTNGETATANFTIHVLPGPTIAQPGGNSFIGSPGSSITLRSVVSGGVPPYTIKWTGVNNTCSTQDCALVLDQNSPVVTETVTDANGASAFALFTIKTTDWYSVDYTINSITVPARGGGEFQISRSSDVNDSSYTYFGLEDKTYNPGMLYQPLYGYAKGGANSISKAGVSSTGNVFMTSVGRGKNGLTPLMYNIYNYILGRDGALRDLGGGSYYKEGPHTAPADTCYPLALPENSPFGYVKSVCHVGTENCIGYDNCPPDTNPLTCYGSTCGGANQPACSCSWKRPNGVAFLNPQTINTGTVTSPSISLVFYFNQITGGINFQATSSINFLPLPTITNPVIGLTPSSFTNTSITVDATATANIGFKDNNKLINQPNISRQYSLSGACSNSCSSTSCSTTSDGIMYMPCTLTSASPNKIILSVKDYYNNITFGAIQQIAYDYNVNPSSPTEPSIFVNPAPVLTSLRTTPFLTQNITKPNIPVTFSANIIRGTAPYTYSFDICKGSACVTTWTSYPLGNCNGASNTTSQSLISCTASFSNLDTYYIRARGTDAVGTEFNGQFYVYVLSIPDVKLSVAPTFIHTPTGTTDVIFKADATCYSGSCSYYWNMSKYLASSPCKYGVDYNSTCVDTFFCGKCGTSICPNPEMASIKCAVPNNLGGGYVKVAVYDSNDPLKWSKTSYLYCNVNAAPATGQTCVLAINKPFSLRAKIPSADEPLNVVPGQSANLSITMQGGIPPYKYHWAAYDQEDPPTANPADLDLSSCDRENVTSLLSQSCSKSFSNFGRVMVSVTATDSANQTEIIPFYVNIVRPPSVDHIIAFYQNRIIPFDSVAPRQYSGQIIFKAMDNTGTGSSGATGGVGGPYTYQWYASGDDPSLTDCSNSTSCSFQFNPNVSYHAVTVIPTDRDGNAGDPVSFPISFIDDKPRIDSITVSGPGFSKYWPSYDQIPDLNYNPVPFSDVNVFPNIGSTLEVITATGTYDLTFTASPAQGGIGPYKYDWYSTDPQDKTIGDCSNSNVCRFDFDALNGEPRLGGRVIRVNVTDSWNFSCANFNIGFPGYTNVVYPPGYVVTHLGSSDSSLVMIAWYNLGPMESTELERLWGYNYTLYDGYSGLCPSAGVDLARHRLSVSCSGTVASSAATSAWVVWQARAKGGNATPFGCSSSYAYYWGDDVTPQGEKSCNNKWAVFYTTRGTRTAKVTVVDYDAKTTTASCSVNITNSSNPLLASCFARTRAISSGGIAGFISSVKGGSGGYAYAWSGACEGASSVCEKQLVNSGKTKQVYTANLTVTDKLGNYSSTTCDIEVNPKPGGSPTVGETCPPAVCSPPEICQGGVCVGPVTVSECSASPLSGVSPLAVTYSPGVILGGNGIYTYTWTGDCQSASENCAGIFTNATAAPILKTSTLVVHSGGQNSNPVNCSATINPSTPVTIAGCFANPDPVTLSGESASTTFSPIGVSGGGGGYIYSWTDTAGNTGSSENFTPSYSSANTYYATITVTGSDSSFATASCPVTVNSLLTNPVSTSPAVAPAYCLAPGMGAAEFRWNYSPGGSGKPQLKFDFQVAESSSAFQPDGTCVSCVINSSDIPALNFTTDIQTPEIKINPGLGDLTYNKTYYWRVKVYNTDSVGSDWVVGPSLTTIANPYPFLDFSIQWNTIPAPPYNSAGPVLGQQVHLIDNSRCYKAGEIVSRKCSDSDLGYSPLYTWSFPGQVSHYPGSMLTAFTVPGNQSVTLQVCDGVNCCPAVSKTVTVLRGKGRKICSQDKKCIVVKGGEGDECETNCDCGSVAQECQNQPPYYICDLQTQACTASFSVWSRASQCNPETPGACVPSSTYLGCRDQKCVNLPKIFGTETDQCLSDSNCIFITHNKCTPSPSPRCIAVQGIGTSDCASSSDCPSNPSGHSECSVNGVCAAVQGSGTTSCPPCPLATHTECSGQQCVNIAGGGSNECLRNNDCLAVHNACTTLNQCVTVLGSGDGCQTDSDCTHTGSHLQCNTNKQCVSVQGEATDTCTVATQLADCLPPCVAPAVWPKPSPYGFYIYPDYFNTVHFNTFHNVCTAFTDSNPNSSKCVPMSGPGADQCNNNRDCAKGVRRVCNSNNQCVLAQGLGLCGDECSVSKDCGRGIPIWKEIAPWEVTQ